MQPSTKLALTIGGGLVSLLLLTKVMGLVYSAAFGILKIGFVVVVVVALVSYVAARLRKGKRGAAD